MKKYLIIPIIITCIICLAPVSHIDNSESGLSTRGKINNLIDTVFALADSVDSLRNDIDSALSIIDTLPGFNDIDTTFQSSKDYTDQSLSTYPDRTELSDSAREIVDWVISQNYSESGLSWTQIIDSIQKQIFDSLKLVIVKIDTNGCNLNGTDTIPGSWIASDGYLQFDCSSRYGSESDPVFLASIAYGITEEDTANWNSSSSNWDSTFIYAQLETLRDSVKVLYDSIATYHAHFTYLYAQVLALWDSLGIVAPDVTAPAFVSAELGTYNDSIILVLWSENIHTDSIPILDSVIITQNGDTVGLAEIINNYDSTFIALDSVLSIGSTLLFTYNLAPDGFQDSSNNKVLSFTDETVTNNLSGYGSELVSNGNFESGAISPWNVKTDWNIQASSGGEYGSYWLRHDVSGYNDETQSVSITPGTTYHTVFSIADMTAGTFYIRVGTTNGTSRNSNGTYTEDILCAGDTFIRLHPGVNFDGAIDNISVKEVLGAYRIDENHLLYALRDVFTGEFSKEVVEK